MSTISAPTRLPSWYFADTSFLQLPRVVICDLEILSLALPSSQLVTDVGRG